MSESEPLLFDGAGNLVTVPFSEIQIGEFFRLTTGITTANGEHDFTVGLTPLCKKDEAHASTYLLNETVEVPPETKVVRFIAQN